MLVTDLPRQELKAEINYDTLLPFNGNNLEKASDGDV